MHLLPFTIPVRENCRLLKYEKVFIFSFSFRSSLSTHLKAHRNDRRHACSTCGRRFVKDSDLRKHLRTHTDERPYPCEACGRRFARRDYLKKHLKNNHAGEQQQQQQQPTAVAAAVVNAAAAEDAAAAAAVEEITSVNALLGEGILSDAVTLDTLETREAIELVLDTTRDMQ